MRLCYYCVNFDYEEGYHYSELTQDAGTFNCGKGHWGGSGTVAGAGFVSMEYAEKCEYFKWTYDMLQYLKSKGIDPQIAQLEEIKVLRDFDKL